jgi:DNA-binding transcriptional MocR family regulator
LVLRRRATATDSKSRAVADRFSRRGEFERYLRRIHRVYRRRMQLMADGLDQHLPPGVEWWRPAGGYTLWMTLPEPVDAEPELCEAIGNAGVRVAPGRVFYDAPPDRAHLRLSIACVGEDRIEEGCRRLGGVLAGR